MGSGAGQDLPDGRRLRWKQHNATRRQTILEAAITALEKNPPGDDIHVQEIAEHARMSRTVVYRHFQDRTDLDLAVQREICAQLGGELLASLSFDGTPREIVHRIVGAFVAWAIEHPALVRFAERDLPGAEVKPMDEAVAQISERIESIMNSVVALLGAELSDVDRAALDPWVFGLVGGCFQAVRRWGTHGEMQPPPEPFVAMLTDAIWHQIRGLAGDRGIDIPDVPVEHLLSSLGPGDERGRGVS